MGNCEEELPKNLSVNCRPTHYRQATDSFPKKKIVEKTRIIHDIERNMCPVMLCYITCLMLLYDMCHVMLYNMSHVMLYNMFHVMLYNIKYALL